MADPSINGGGKEFDVVGEPNLPGKLAPTIASGKAKFATDWVEPNMLFANFLRGKASMLLVNTISAGNGKRKGEIK
jgi:hypothetical protein